MRLTEYILMTEAGSMKYTTTDKINEEPDLSKAGKDKKVRVIPGFHLTLGITVTMLSLIVLISACVSYGLFVKALTNGVYKSCY